MEKETEEIVTAICDKCGEDFKIRVSDLNEINLCPSCLSDCLTDYCG